MLVNHRAVLGSNWGTNLGALGVFRIALAVALLLELHDRTFSEGNVAGFYSDQGIWPAQFMHERSSAMHIWLCPHSWQNGAFFAPLVAAQFALAVCLMLGWHTRLVAILSWFLYNSLTLRNVWLSYIADRYFHILLLYASLLPCGARMSWDGLVAKQGPRTVNIKGDDTAWAASWQLLGTLYKLQILWIYLDAGYGKWTDPLGGWSYNASPLPALDTYTRHTSFAVWLYKLIGPFGLRLLTPAVVGVELLAPMAVILSGCMRVPASLQIFLISLLPSMHVGISLTLVNTVSLSIVAMVSWIPFLPEVLFDGVVDQEQDGIDNSSRRSSSSSNPRSTFSISQLPLPIMLVFIGLCVHYERHSGLACSQNGASTLKSVLFNNRWNVFIGAETYVTWEICPAKLANGKIVDLWKRGGQVTWHVPSLSYSNASYSAQQDPEEGPGGKFARRSGRWRSFPYLSVADSPSDDSIRQSLKSESSCQATENYADPIDGAFRDRMWNYLCKEWNANHSDDEKVLKYSFFMLQADILPDLQYTDVRKRLIHSHVCGT